MVWRLLMENNDELTINRVDYKGQEVYEIVFYEKRTNGGYDAVGSEYRKNLEDAKIVFTTRLSGNPRQRVAQFILRTPESALTYFEGAI